LFFWYFRDIIQENSTHLIVRVISLNILLISELFSRCYWFVIEMSFVNSFESLLIGRAFLARVAQRRKQRKTAASALKCDRVFLIKAIAQMT